MVGVPTISGTRSLTLDDVYRIPQVSEPQITSGTVAFVVTTADRPSDENRSAIWTVPTSGGPAVRRTDGPHDHSPRWSPDGTTLAYVAALPDGDRIVIGDTVFAAGGRSTGGLAWSPDGRSLAYTAVVVPEGFDDNAPIVTRLVHDKADGAGLLRGWRQHIFVASLDTGTSKALTSGDWSVSGPIAWSPDGSSLTFAAAQSADRDLTPVSHVFVVTVADGVVRQVTEHAGTAASPTFTPSGDRILFAGRADVAVGHAQLWTVPASGGAPSLVTGGFDRNVMVGATAYPGATPTVTGDSILFCARDGGCTHVFSVPLAGGTVTKVIGAADTVISGLSVGADAVAYVEADPSTCGEVWVAAWDGGRARRLTDLVAAALEDVSVSVPSARTFHAPDGTAVAGWVLRSAGTGPSPLLLDIHGGPHNAWNPVLDPPHMYQHVLAAQGWTVLYINPRGSDGYGESFFTALDKDGWGRADANDFLAAVDSLIAGGDVDPARIVVTGYSYGGYMTNWLTATTDRFAAAISGGCVTNLVSMAASDIGPSLDAHELGATPWDNPERLVDLSPLTYVRGVRAPTLILHGQLDDRCPVGQAEEWFASLRGLGIEVEMVRYPGASHGFVREGRPSHRVDYCRRVEEWALRFT